MLAKLTEGFLVLFPQPAGNGQGVTTGPARIGLALISPLAFPALQVSVESGLVQMRAFGEGRIQRSEELFPAFEIEAAKHAGPLAS